MKKPNLTIFEYNFRNKNIYLTINRKKKIITKASTLDHMDHQF